MLDMYDVTKLVLLTNPTSEGNQPTVPTERDAQRASEMREQVNRQCQRIYSGLAEFKPGTTRFSTHETTLEILSQQVNLLAEIIRCDSEGRIPQEFALQILPLLAEHQTAIEEKIKSAIKLVNYTVRNRVIAQLKKTIGAERVRALIPLPSKDKPLDILNPWKRYQNEIEKSRIIPINANNATFYVTCPYTMRTVTTDGCSSDIGEEDSSFFETVKEWLVGDRTRDLDLSAQNFDPAILDECLKLADEQTPYTFSYRCVEDSPGKYRYKVETKKKWNIQQAIAIATYSHYLGSFNGVLSAGISLIQQSSPSDPATLNWMTPDLYKIFESFKFKKKDSPNFDDNYLTKALKEEMAVKFINLTADEYRKIRPLIQTPDHPMRLAFAFASVELLNNLFNIMKISKLQDLDLHETFLEMLPELEEIAYETLPDLEKALPRHEFKTIKWVVDPHWEYDRNNLLGPEESGLVPDQLAAFTAKFPHAKLALEKSFSPQFPVSKESLGYFDRVHVKNFGDQERLDTLFHALRVPLLKESRLRELSLNIPFRRITGMFLRVLHQHPLLEKLELEGFVKKERIECEPLTSVRELVINSYLRESKGDVEWYTSEPVDLKWIGELFPNLRIMSLAFEDSLAQDELNHLLSFANLEEMHLKRRKRSGDLIDTSKIDFSQLKAPPKTLKKLTIDWNGAVLFNQLSFFEKVSKWAKMFDLCIELKNIRSLPPRDSHLKCENLDLLWEYSMLTYQTGSITEFNLVFQNGTIAIPVEEHVAKKLDETSLI